MNERIKELAASAYLYAREIQSVNDNDADKYYLDFQAKFAELLIGECLDIVANADMANLEGPDPEDVLLVACNLIKEQFGVE